MAKVEKRRVKIRQIMPEDLGLDEYTKYKEEIANDDPEELARERKRVLFKLQVYGKGVMGKESLAQMKPMIESMTLRDCKNLCKTLDEKGPMALVQMLRQHEKETQSANRKSADTSTDNV